MDNSRKRKNATKTRKRPRERRIQKAAAAGRVQERRAQSPKKKTTTSKTVFLIASLVILLLVASVAAVIYVITALPKDSCYDVAQVLNNGDALPVNPIKMQECKLKSCSFDIKQCRVLCPFSFETDKDTGCPVSCQCGSRGIFQGDIQFDEDDVAEMLTSYGYQEEATDFEIFFGTAFGIWDNVVIDGRVKVPYEFEADMKQETLKSWNTVVQEYASQTCIDFVHHTDEESFLEVVQTVNCASKIGRISGPQFLELGFGCHYRAIVQHELLHALGFDHEQARPDRDLHITIHEDNIESHYLHNFRKLRYEEALDLKSPYDKESTLHYRSDTFALPGTYSITFKPNDDAILEGSETTFMTKEDVREVNLLYNCDITMSGEKGTWEEWEPWSECTVTCKTGLRTRKRKCLDSSGQEIGNCDGGTFDVEVCDLGECPPPHGVFEEWGDWSECTKTCDVGETTRYRNCPKKYPDGCVGLYPMHHLEAKVCRVANCDGSPVQPLKTLWGDWYEINPCDATCGGGVRKKAMKCGVEGIWKSILNCGEVPEKDVELAWDTLFKLEVCNTGPCGGLPIPVTEATIPTMSSAGGQFLTSTFLNTLPTYTNTPPDNISPLTTTMSSGGGQFLTSNLLNTLPPYTNTPPDNISPLTTTPSGPISTPHKGDMWSEWKAWGLCDKTCGKGNRFRTRKCLISSCVANTHEQETCSLQTCSESDTSSTVSPRPITGWTEMWSEWSPWGGCDKLCGAGNRVRVRRCASHWCYDDAFETESCNEKPCSGESVPGSTLFSKPSQTLSFVCTYGRLMSGHFNADLYADLMCLYADGWVQIYFSSGRKIEKTVGWEGQVTLCNFQEEVKVQIFVSDINGDKLDDLLCLGGITKTFEVALNKGGSFSPTVDWSGQRSLCQNFADRLKVHDLDGDGKSDLICGSRDAAFQSVIFHVR